MLVILDYRTHKELFKILGLSISFRQSGHKDNNPFGNISIDVSLDEYFAELIGMKSLDIKGFVQL